MESVTCFRGEGEGQKVHPEHTVSQFPSAYDTHYATKVPYFGVACSKTHQLSSMEENRYRTTEWKS